MDTNKDFGTQFDAERFQTGQDYETLITDFLNTVFQPHNIVAVEPDETYDNYADKKQIHQVIDYTGIDYLLDPFDEPVFGVNHRSHTPTAATLRLDLRYDTGTSAPSELEKLLHAESGDLIPKYATRLKKAQNGGVEWFRVTELAPVVKHIQDGTLEPDKKWHDENRDVTAWLFDYETLNQFDCIVADIYPESDEQTS